MYQELAIRPWQVAAALGQKQRGKRYCINEALIDCFAAAGFAVRDGMTQDELELFVFEALVESVIVPGDEYVALHRALATPLHN